MSRPDPAITADLLKQIPTTKTPAAAHNAANPAGHDGHGHPQPPSPNSSKDHTHALSRAANGPNHMRSNNRGK